MPCLLRWHRAGARSLGEWESPGGALSSFLKALRSVVPAREHSHSLCMKARLGFSQRQENGCESLRSQIPLMTIVKVNFSRSCYGDYDKSKLIIELMLTDQSAKSRQRRLWKSQSEGAEGEPLCTQQSHREMETRSTRERLQAWLSTWLGKEGRWCSQLTAFSLQPELTSTFRGGTGPTAWKFCQPLRFPARSSSKGNWGKAGLARRSPLSLRHRADSAARNKIAGRINVIIQGLKKKKIQNLSSTVCPEPTFL